jgi:transposase InsO family protein
MGPCTAWYNYLLFRKDDLSGYLRLVPAKAVDAETTGESLTFWFTTLGVVATWMSGHGSHFKSKLVEGVRRALGTRHHFKTAYSPLTNGTVERACREVLRAVRALLSEFKLRSAAWTDVFKIVQSALNNSPSP